MCCVYISKSSLIFCFCFKNKKLGQFVYTYCIPNNAIKVGYKIQYRCMYSNYIAVVLTKYNGN